MSAAVPARARRPDVAGARAIVEFMARVHDVVPEPSALDAAGRRIETQAAAPDAVNVLQALTAEAGLATAVVRRPLDEVIRDADPAYPWLAVRAGADGRLEGVAVFGAARGGVAVAVPGAHGRPARWSRRSLRQWLGVDEDGAVVDWVLAEPAAPLSGLRSGPGAPATPFERVRALLHGERRTLWVAVVYSVVIALLSLAVPVAVQSLVNTIAFGNVLQPLVVLTVFVFVALGFNTVMNAMRATVVEIVQRSIFARVATDVTWRLLRVRVEAFDRLHGPELVNRFFDTVTVQKSAALLLIDGLSIVMQTAIGMLLLAVYHPWLLAFDLLLIVAMAGIVVVQGRGAVTTAIKESKAKHALEAWLEHLAAHLVTFKSAGGAAYAVRRSHRLLESYLSYRSQHFAILIRQTVSSFALKALASSALLGIGGWLVISRQLTLGQLVASELIVAGMLSAFTKFGKQLEVFYDLCAALDKLGGLIDLPLERSGGDADLPGDGPMDLELRDLDVRYENDDRPALRIRQWSVSAGERVGVTGPHGSGKSTLADVLFGLRQPAAGTVRVQGIDLRHLPLAAMRQQVALVRGVELFPGSIADNVRLGRDELSHADVTAALAAVGLLDELQRLPQGLDTELHPHGRPLSHRQACRLMIARAIVGRPRLIVLDGILDQIDRADDQEQLTAVLFAAAAPWTLVCVTDRPALLARCGRVVELHDGEMRPSPPEARR
ncbi:MAG: peptidase domain-containing ABC transporter [Vicinamibacterales bacterium]